MAGISSLHVGCLERVCLLGNARILRNASLGLLRDSSTFQNSWISQGFAVTAQKKKKKGVFKARLSGRNGREQEAPIIPRGLLGPPSLSSVTALEAPGPSHP